MIMNVVAKLIRGEKLRYRRVEVYTLLADPDAPVGSSEWSLPVVRGDDGVLRFASGVGYQPVEGLANLKDERTEK